VRAIFLSMMVAKANIRAVFQYKQVSPEIAHVKTQAILRIIAASLKKQNLKEKECGECLTKV